MNKIRSGTAAKILAELDAAKSAFVGRSGLEAWEKETIIRFSAGEDDAYIFTYQRGWQNRLKKLGAKEIMDNGFGAKEFVVDKVWVRMPLPPRKGKKSNDD